MWLLHLLASWSTLQCVLHMLSRKLCITSGGKSLSRVVALPSVSRLACMLQARSAPYLRLFCQEACLLVRNGSCCLFTPFISQQCFPQPKSQATFIEGLTPRQPDALGLCPCSCVLVHHMCLCILCT